MGTLFTFGRWILNAREWLILLAMAGVAAFFYADSRHVRADRDAWSSWADKACGFAGTVTAPAIVEVETDQGKRKVEKARGQICSEAVQDLAVFKIRSAEETARVLANAQAEAARKAQADLASAHRDTEEQRRAAALMEKIDAQIGSDDRVGGDWFARLNELGGLRSRD